MPTTKSGKFQYADDIALAYQSKAAIECNEVLTYDLKILNDYLHAWRLCINLHKTETSLFHPTMQITKSELNVTSGNDKVNFINRTYLGVALYVNIQAAH